MYNANLTYEENYKNGPDITLVQEKKFPKVSYSGVPKYNFLGIPLYIPFGVPAGPLLNSAYMQVAFEAGFTLPTYKTVRSRFQKGHSWPNILSVSEKNARTSIFSNAENEVIASAFTKTDYQNKKISITNSFGVPSQDPKVWIKDYEKLQPFNAQLGQHSILSFQPSYDQNASGTESKRLFHADVERTVIYALNALAKGGSKILEMNLSCPNEVHEPLYKDLQQCKLILKIVYCILQREAPHVKLLIKIGVLNSIECLRFLGEIVEYVDGISAINTVSGLILNSKGEAALSSGLKHGGICGNLIYEQGIRMVGLLAELREHLGLSNTKIALVGVGGVSSVSDFKAYISAGADVVQAATGMIWNLNLAKNIAENLGVLV